LENKETIDIAAVVIMGSLGMLFLASGLIIFVVLYQKRVLQQKAQVQEAENRHQKAVLKATVEVAEHEREKIAKNIHDDVGTALNVLKLQLTKISRHAGDAQQTESIVQESIGLLDESISNVRGIARDLMPPTLIKLGFEKGLSELCRQIDASGAVQVEQAIDFSKIKLPTRYEIQLYRAIREAINNILKHAEATLIQVSSETLLDRFQVHVSHNGKGITSEQAETLMQSDKGVGLKSIQSRVQLIKGTIQYLTLDLGKSTVLFEIPFAENE
jgi:two-component system, NarL family, sensor kinase